MVGTPRPELGGDRVVAGDVDQGRDHPAVEPVGAVGSAKLVPPGQAHLHRAVLGPDHLDADQAMEGRLVDAKVLAHRWDSRGGSWAARRLSAERSSFPVPPSGSWSRKKTRRGWA